MRTHRFVARLSLIALSAGIPLSSFAASASAIIKTADDAAVSRGDFLRAAIVALDIPVERTKLVGTYARPVPKSMHPYVRTAEKEGAIGVFGRELALAMSITRGEAASVLAELRNIKPVADAESFSDIEKGSSEEYGVRVAIEQGWMKPVKTGFFGADRSLTGREARTMIEKASGKETIRVETGSNSTTIRINKPGASPQLPENDLLRAVWDLLNKQYLYTDKIDDKEAAYKAAEGLVNSLGDPYTTFMRPLDTKQFQQQIDGEVIGIGAQVEYVDNALTVVAPLTGSPAEKVGILAGDRITAVDGVSLAGLSLAQSVEKIRGPKGTTVTLTVNRNGEEFDVRITRDVVRMPEIDISFRGNVAVVKLAQFGKTVDTKLRGLMEDVAEQNPTGVVLDLRNNPGGLLHAAEIVLSNFLPEGTVVAEIKAKTSDADDVTRDPPTISSDIPVAVLVNKGSASASEIVAGALQDHGRAIIVGETTFGKGTVQQIIDFRDGSSMKMTIAEWFTPKGRKINGVGLTPDVIVSPGTGRDEQLQRALDELR